MAWPVKGAEPGIFAFIGTRPRDARFSSRLRKLWPGCPSLVSFSAALRSAFSERSVRTKGVLAGGLLPDGILVGEEYLLEVSLHVPLGVGGKKAEEDVGSHHVVVPVEDRPHLQRGGLEHAKDALDPAYNQHT